MSVKNENIGDNDRLTTPEFWDSCYQGREPVPFNDKNWRNYASIQLVRLIESLKLNEKRVCEVGGGDAEVSAYLAGKYKGSEFSIIDYSPLGCALARKRAALESVEINVLQSDFFSPPLELCGYFDLVTSYGVVEHFSDLSSVLKAKSILIKIQEKFLH